MTTIAGVVAPLLACAMTVTAASGEEAVDLTFSINSPAFSDGQPIPPRFTADGSDVSPEIRIENPPASVASFALIVDDPDAPVGTWVHWVVWNLPATTDTTAEGSLPDGAVEGRNSWGRNAYGGPSPPSGTHRYFFKLYALDTVLDLPTNTDKAGLERAMQGHVLAEAVLMGRYSR
jgi:Raf kinase inhibitor-like YbhB/YbcL family protein